MAFTAAHATNRQIVQHVALLHGSLKLTSKSKPCAFLNKQKRRSQHRAVRCLFHPRFYPFQECAMENECRLCISDNAKCFGPAAVKLCCSIVGLPCSAGNRDTAAEAAAAAGARERREHSQVREYFLMLT